MTQTSTAAPATTAANTLPGQDAPDLCDCCQAAPGRNPWAGSWVCDPCESFLGTRTAGPQRP